jgi:hypothetical protein
MDDNSSHSVAKPGLSFRGALHVLLPPIAPNPSLFAQKTIEGAKGGLHGNYRGRRGLSPTRPGRCCLCHCSYYMNICRSTDFMTASSIHSNSEWVSHVAHVSVVAEKGNI